MSKVRTISNFRIRLHNRRVHVFKMDDNGEITYLVRCRMLIDAKTREIRKTDIAFSAEAMEFVASAYFESLDPSRDGRSWTANVAKDKEARHE